MALFSSTAQGGAGFWMRNFSEKGKYEKRQSEATTAASKQRAVGHRKPLLWFAYHFLSPAEMGSNCHQTHAFCFRSQLEVGTDSGFWDLLGKVTANQTNGAASK